ncbi:MAG: hypothetical protein KC422_06100 [Trueperaceae bacterium]|nr:hypothetical protein [Trueperaceae bacterium]
MSQLSAIQKEKFLAISGHAYSGKALKGRFSTKRPYNQDDYPYSPWLFSYIIELDTGNLICELVHRMTNNRIYGWDREGNELPETVLYKYFTPHL